MPGPDRFTARPSLLSLLTKFSVYSKLKTSVRPRGIGPDSKIVLLLFLKKMQSFWARGCCLFFFIQDAFRSLTNATTTIKNKLINHANDANIKANPPTGPPWLPTNIWLAASNNVLIKGNTSTVALKIQGVSIYICVINILEPTSDALKEAEVRCWFWFSLPAEPPGRQEAAGSQQWCGNDSDEEWSQLGQLQLSVMPRGDERERAAPPGRAGGGWGEFHRVHRR